MCLYTYGFNSNTIHFFRNQSILMHYWSKSLFMQAWCASKITQLAYSRHAESVCIRLCYPSENVIFSSLLLLFQFILSRCYYISEHTCVPLILTHTVHSCGPPGSHTQLTQSHWTPHVTLWNLVPWAPLQFYATNGPCLPLLLLYLLPWTALAGHVHLTQLSRLGLHSNSVIQVYSGEKQVLAPS